MTSLLGREIKSLNSAPEICVQKPRATERGRHGFGSTDKSAPAASATFPSHSWSSTGTDTWFAMPRGANGSGHSPFLGLPPFSACVDRPVPRKEAKMNPKAFAALERAWVVGTKQRYQCGVKLPLKRNVMVSRCMLDGSSTSVLRRTTNSAKMSRKVQGPHCVRRMPRKR